MAAPYGAAMKHVSIAAALILAIVAGFSTIAGAGNNRAVVVELYTSQGCSSCPPADALLAKLAKQADRRDLIVMSLPITYWDMLGWKDTLASEANTRRQKAYAAAMGHGGVYTPQIIVDGAIDVVGGREDKVDAAIEEARDASDATEAMRDATREMVEDRQDVADDGTMTPAAGLTRLPAKALEKIRTVVVDLSQVRQKLHVVIAAAPVLARKPKPNATIWLFRLRSSVTVHIAAGENSGRTATYRNVVAGPIEDIGKWRGQTVTVDIPQTGAPPHDGVVVLVQQGGFGRVLGAAYLGRTDYYASR